MNRALVFGIAIFFAIVGIALMGSDNKVLAGHGCNGCNGGCHACDGGCDGGCHADRGCHHRRQRCHGRHRRNRCHGCNGGGCHGGYGCNGGGCHGGCGGGYGAPMMEGAPIGAEQAPPAPPAPAAPAPPAA